MEKEKKIRERGFENFKWMIKELKVNKFFGRMIATTPWFKKHHKEILMNINRLANYGKYPLCINVVLYL